MTIGGRLLGRPPPLRHAVRHEKQSRGVCLSGLGVWRSWCVVFIRGHRCLADETAGERERQRIGDPDDGEGRTASEPHPDALAVSLASPSGRKRLTRRVDGAVLVRVRPHAVCSTQQARPIDSGMCLGRAGVGANPQSGYRLGQS